MTGCSHKAFLSVLPANCYSSSRPSLTFRPRLSGTTARQRPCVTSTIQLLDMKVSDYYAVLEISKSCTQADIKKA